VGSVLGSAVAKSVETYPSNINDNAIKFETQTTLQELNWSQLVLEYFEIEKNVVRSLHAQFIQS